MKPRVKKVYSENNDYQHVEVIKRNREKRHKSKEFFVEGVKSINYALENHWAVKTLIYSREKPLSEWAENVIKASAAEAHFEMPLKLMDKLSEKDEDYSEIMAVVEMPEDNLSRIKGKKDMLVVVFDRPSSHGNLGTLIRSCEALKVDGIIISGHAVDLYDPKTIRSSMGTFFSVPTVRVESHRELIPWIEGMKCLYGDFQVVGSTAKTDTYVMDVDFKKPTALLIGNETYGLSNNYKALCDTLAKVPMYGKITSFNVACAASIILYEIDRQRNF